MGWDLVNIVSNGVKACGVATSSGTIETYKHEQAVNPLWLNVITFATILVGSPPGSCDDLTHWPLGNLNEILDM